MKVNLDVSVGKVLDAIKNHPDLASTAGGSVPGGL